MQAKIDGALPDELTPEENEGAEIAIEEKAALENALAEVTDAVSKVATSEHNGGPPRRGGLHGRVIRHGSLVRPVDGKMAFWQKTYTFVPRDPKEKPAKIEKTFGPYHTNRATRRALTRMMVKAMHGPKKARIA